MQVWGPLNSYCHCQEKSYLRMNWAWGAALSSTINVEIGWTTAFKPILQVVSTKSWDLQLSEPQFIVWINLLLNLFQSLLSLLYWFWIVKPPVLKWCYITFRFLHCGQWDHLTMLLCLSPFPPKRLWLNLSGQGLDLVIHHHQIRYRQAWVKNAKCLPSRRDCRRRKIRK